MRIGAHQSIAGGISQAFARAEAQGARSLQVFTKSARGWYAPPLAESERIAFRQQARRSGLPVVAHGSYLANLGTEDPVLREKSLLCVIDELQRCERLGIPDLVMHPGGHPDEKTGLALIFSPVQMDARLGVCLDTCHLHAAGHDLTTRRSYEKLMARFDALLGIPRVRCIHLNDCKKERGFGWIATRKSVREPWGWQLSGRW